MILDDTRQFDFVSVLTLVLTLVLGTFVWSLVHGLATSSIVCIYALGVHLALASALACALYRTHLERGTATARNAQ